jgi:hypothetical protein
VSYAFLKSKNTQAAVLDSGSAWGNNCNNMMFSPMWRPGKKAVCSGLITASCTSLRRRANNLANTL